MATLDDLVASGKIKKHVPDLESHELPVRLVYVTGEFEKWVQSVLIAEPKDRGRDLLPWEQVEQALYDFVIGRPMAYGQDYKPLTPIGHYIWELKTEDVRLFGWFPRKSCFLIVLGKMKKEMLKAKDYKVHIENTLQFRAQLDLDEPKTITGVSSHDVL